MDCKKAGLLMMQYMDKALPNREQRLLDKHMNSCGACKEDFSVYNSIMSGFSEIEIINAPDDLEKNVMARISELSFEKEKKTVALDNLLYFTFGAFSILIGVSFVFSLNKDRIIEYMYTKPGLGILADFFAALSDYATRFSLNLTQLTNDLLTSFSDYFLYARYVLIAAFIVLGIMRYILYRKDKVEA